MKDSKKAKWIIGASGFMLSAVLLTQINSADQTEATSLNNFQLTKQQEKELTAREKELIQLDWTNFEFEVANQPMTKSDRKTKRT